MRDVVEMAREAGAVFPADGSYHKFEFEGSLERFAELVRADEREACAKVCDERAQKVGLSNHRRCDADLLASTIRARGQA